MRFHRGLKKIMCMIFFFFLINWHDRVGKKKKHFTNHFIFFKIVRLKMVLEIND